MKQAPTLRLSAREIRLRLSGTSPDLSAQFPLSKPLLAGPAEFLFTRLQRSRTRRFLRRLVFEYSPFKLRFAFAVIFRHHTGIAALDPLVAKSCAPHIQDHLD